MPKPQPERYRQPDETEQRYRDRIKAMLEECSGMVVNIRTTSAGYHVAGFIPSQGAQPFIEIDRKQLHSIPKLFFEAVDMLRRAHVLALTHPNSQKENAKS